MNANSVTAEYGASLTTGSGMTFVGTGNAQIAAQHNGNVYVTANYTIAGSAVHHLDAFDRASIYYSPNLTVTLTGTPNFSGAFLYAYGNSFVIFWYPSGRTAWSGSATGVRYQAFSLSCIDTAGAATTYLPGNSAGSLAGGSQYQ
jgi:hypothetical protein